LSEDAHTAAASLSVAEPGAARHFAVPADRLLQDWKSAYERGLLYLEALGVPTRERAHLAGAAVERALQHPQWDAGSDAVKETLRALRALLLESYPPPASPGVGGQDGFTAWRLDAYLSERFASDDGSSDAVPTAEQRRRPARHWTEKAGASGDGHLPPLRDGTFGSMPQLRRRAMCPEKIERRFLRRLANRIRGRAQRWARTPEQRETLRTQRRRLAWIGVAQRRRLLLAALVLIPSTIASGFMVNVLPHQGSTWLEFAIVLFFGALFGWISIGFWTALLGFLTLIGRRRRFAITSIDPSDTAEFHPAGRTAIVMPICEEPVDRVFAGLKAIHDSLERTGALPYFDFFVLSDSRDPSTWVREEEAWAGWCRSMDGFTRVFYRRRRVRLKRKSGNVADFCRRWGSRYRYMIMLDADSIMAGPTLVRLVRMMERHPDVGMIQTAPSAVNRRSLFARVQQFASRVYGPMFAAGLHFWQLGDGQYWGHNTIIRVAPFMDHCGLPRLPGKPPLGGEIMSHDFVEAALMGRSGWTLWLAFDLPGSYEEVPSTLLEEMKRDRRWCQGNLQHLRLLFTEGLFGAHRALFINGVLSYVSALLWFAFLSVSTAEAIRNVWHEPEYFPHGRSLFPEWPIWRPDWALYLMAVTGMILFLPKVLSIVLIVFKGRNTRAYGGFFKLSFSVLLEILLSSLFAPIRMVFHSRFVLQNVLGRTVTWRSQGREDAETGWREALRHHGLDTLSASAWGTGLYWLNPGYFWWVTPIIGALILSVPLSVFASRVRLGDRARAWGLFLIPEETTLPRELQDLRDYQEAAQLQAVQLPKAEADGFVRAAVDPYVNALHRALLGRSRLLNPSIRAARAAWLDCALAKGPAALQPWQRSVLLSDPDMVTELHHRVWELADRERAVRWGRPGGRRLGAPDGAA
jgi:membrane glycosyltransferase